MVNPNPPRDSAYFRKWLLAMRRSRNFWPVVNVLAIWCFVFCMVGTFHCSFMMVSTGILGGTNSGSDSTNTDNMTMANAEDDSSGVETTTSTTSYPKPVGIGLFTTSVYDMDHNLLGCVSYYGSSDEFDGAFRAARAFGMMASIATTLAMILVSLVTLFLPANNAAVQCWTASRLLFFVAFVAQLLAFMAFGRDLCGTDGVDCQPGPASIIAMLNLFFLCITSALCYVVPPPPTPLFVLRAKHRQSTPPPPSLLEIQRKHMKTPDPSHAATVTSTGDHNHHSTPEATNTSSTQDIMDPNNHNVVDFEIVSISPPRTSNAHDTLDGMVLVEEDTFYQNTGTEMAVPRITNQTKANVASDAQGEEEQEGIECVDTDHRSRRTTNNITGNSKAKTFLVELLDRYFEIGQGRGFRITMGVLLVKAWVLSIVGVSRCTFVLVGIYGESRADFSGLGLFNRAYYRHDDILGCIAYPAAARTEFDAAYQVGRAFGIMSLILITFALVSFVVLHGFIEHSLRKEQVWLGLTQATMPCALIAHLLLFTAFQTESCTQSATIKCVPGVAGIMAILNVFLLVPLAFFIFALPCPMDPLFCVRPPPPPRISKRHQTKQAERQPSPTSGSFLVCPTRDSGDDDNAAELLQLRKLQMLQALATPNHSSSNSSSFSEGVRVRSFQPSVEVTSTSENGTRTTIQEIVHADGTKSLTTTTIEAVGTTRSARTFGTTTTKCSSMRIGRRMRKFTTRSQRLKQEQRERERLLEEQQQQEDSKCCIIDPSGMTLLGYQGVYSDDNSDKADTITLNSVYTNTVTGTCTGTGTGGTNDAEAGGTCAAHTGSSNDDLEEEITSSAEAYTSSAEAYTSSGDDCTFNTGAAIDNDTVVAALKQQGESSLQSNQQLIE